MEIKVCTIALQWISDQCSILTFSARFKPSRSVYSISEQAVPRHLYTNHPGTTRTYVKTTKRLKRCRIFVFSFSTVMKTVEQRRRHRSNHYSSWWGTAKQIVLLYSNLLSQLLSYLGLLTPHNCGVSCLLNSIVFSWIPKEKVLKKYKIFSDTYINKIKRKTASKLLIIFFI